MSEDAQYILVADILLSMEGRDKRWKMGRMMSNSSEILDNSNH